MSEASELLATLRDIGEPPPPAGVPPALVLADVALLALVLGTLAWRRRRRRRAWLDTALDRVRATRGRPPDAARLELARVLRRVMRHRHGTSVDVLQGDAWLARLDATFGDDWFTRGAGRAFGEALYAPATAARVDTDELGRQLARRLRRLPRAARSARPPAAPGEATAPSADADRTSLASPRR